MTKLAKQYRLSDVGLRKICTKHGIPTPPLGYWAKLSHGKKVVQPQLPPLKPGESERINLTAAPIQKLPDAEAEELQHALAREADSGRKIIAPSQRPRKLHEVAERAETALRDAKPDHYHLCKFLADWSPAIYVAKTSIGRAVRILDTIAKEIERRGGEVSCNDRDIRIVFAGEPFHLRIYELKDKTAHVPTAEDKRRQRQHDELAARHPDTWEVGRKVTPYWSYGPSGRLAIEVTDATGYRGSKEYEVGRWYDRGVTVLEDRLNEIFLALFPAAAVARHRRLEKEAAQREDERKAELARQEAARKERAKNREKFVVELAEDYARYRRLAEFADVFNALTAAAGDAPAGRMATTFKKMVDDAARRFTIEQLSSEIDRRKLFGEGD
jgi:hypothetical protein